MNAPLAFTTAEMRPGRPPLPDDVAPASDTRRTIPVEVHIQSTSSVSVGMTIHGLREEVKKNWPLIAALIACNLLSAIPAYFLNGWASVAVTVFFVLLSAVLGYYAITRVITITKETR
jgi:hypothetical protein